MSRTLTLHRSLRLLWLAVATLCVLRPSAPAQQDWISAGTLNVPDYRYSFLAATPAGDLLAATFNGTNEPADAPLVLIRNPISASPEVQTITTVRFEGQRGFSGLAVAADGSFFTAGDTGAEGSSFVRKYLPNGQPDRRFGQGGEMRPGARALGLDVLGDHVLVALNWGRIAVLRAADGAILGEVPRPDSGFFLRDIAIDPATLNVYGIAAGSVHLWSGGQPWAPTTYRRRLLLEREGAVRSGEGISIDPLTRNALATPIPGNTLVSVGPDGRATESRIATAQDDSELTDTSLSFDGTTLFVSDLRKRLIHVMRREGGLADAGPRTTTASALVTAAAAANEPTPTPPPTSNYQTTTTWYRSYEGIVQDARRYRKPMLVYFRRRDFPLCHNVEYDMLLTPEFDAAVAAKGLVCVFEDVSVNTLIAYRLGVFRVPHVEVFDSQGRSVARLSHDFTKQDLLDTIARVR